MANISGEDGAATLTAGAINITSWTVTKTAEVQNTTNSGTENNAKTFIPSGFTEWSGSMEGLVETGDAGGETVGDDPAALVLTAKSGVTWTGNAIITSATFVCVVAGTDSLKYSYTFQGTAALTPVNA